MIERSEELNDEYPGLDIKKTDVDPKQLAAFTSEEDFNALAVDLLREVASWVCLAGGVLPMDTKCWTREQAIVGGNLIRLFKLLCGVLDQTCQHRRETMFIFSRLAFESIVNIRYLIKFASTELFDSYIRYSLKHERRLRDRIKANIEARGGEVWPIEHRMLSSIQQTAKKSGVDLDQISTSQPKNWGGKNLYERADAVDLGYLYLAAFGGASHSVHGNWMDLLEYHIDDAESDKVDSFLPYPDWHAPRPQPLIMLAKLTVDLLQNFFVFVRNASGSIPESASLTDLRIRIAVADDAHEHFLIKQDEVAHELSKGKQIVEINVIRPLQFLI